MNAKNMLFVFMVMILTLSLAACGAKAPAIDPSAVPQQFYDALNAGDIDAVMAMLHEDVQCRGVCYLTGKDSMRTYLQGMIDGGGTTQVRDVSVDGDTISYTWDGYAPDGFLIITGTEVMKLKDGLIILIETTT